MRDARGRRRQDAVRGGVAPPRRDGSRAPSGGGAAILDASAKATGDALLVEVRVHAPPHAPTQTPVTREEGPTYEAGASFEALVPYPGTRPHRYAELPGAWRVAVEPLTASTTRWPWRTSLAKADLAATWNRANVVLPAIPGDAAVRVRIVAPAALEKLRVTLLRDGQEHGTREVTVTR